MEAQCSAEEIVVKVFPLNLTANKVALKHFSFNQILSNARLLSNIWMNSESVISHAFSETSQLTIHAFKNPVENRSGQT